MPAGIYVVVRHSGPCTQTHSTQTHTYRLLAFAASSLFKRLVLRALAERFAALFKPKPLLVENQ